MADIASTDVTYTIQEPIRKRNARKEVRAKVEFGDGALTYPSGGVPLLKAQLGLSTNIESLVIFDQEDGDGFVYKYDFENDKVRIYQGDYSEAADGPLVELAGGVATPAATDLYVEAVGF